MNPPLSASSADIVDGVHYPSSDGLPVAETAVHVLQAFRAMALLRHHFRDQADVYVIANIFWYFEKGNPKKCRSPDVMFVRGVDGAKERRSFRSWDEPADPSAIFEMTSKETAKEDVGPKKDEYERLGVREYFLFDALGEYLDTPLTGFRLQLGKYEPIAPGFDGRLRSLELGLWIVPEHHNLRYFDARTNEELLDLPDMADRVDDLQKEVEQLNRWANLAERQVGIEKERADAEKLRADTEKQRADDAERRTAELIAELTKLRANSPTPPSAE